MSSECIPNFGLLNTMPSPVFLSTEHQWRDSFGGHATITPVRFDDDPRTEARFPIINNTVPISSVANDLDGLIVTGANLECREDGSPLPFEEISYFEQLKEVIEWAEANSRLTVYSCLASHIALNHMFGIDREIQPYKVFGVYDHENVQESWLTTGIDHDPKGIRAPHSRWGNVATKLLEDAGIRVLVSGEQAGWLCAESGNPGNRVVFLQAHPEIGRDDLRAQFERDRQSGQPIPANYYPNDDPSLLPVYDWDAQARGLFRNMAQASI